MRRMVIAAAAVLALTTSTPRAEALTRYNWVPDVTTTLIGDMWTFVCPTGGSFNIYVDTANGSPTNSNLDLAFTVLDGNGVYVTSADDAFACFYPSACGYQCPSTSGYLPCGPGKTHSLLIYDTGAGGGSCVGGGAYFLSIDVKDANSISLPERAVKLGGGPKRKLPAWANPNGGNTYGPAFDDEGLMY